MFTTKPALLSSQRERHEPNSRKRGQVSERKRFGSARLVVYKFLTCRSRPRQCCLPCVRARFVACCACHPKTKIVSCVCVFVLCFLVFKQFVSFLPVAFRRLQASVVDGTFNYFSLGSGQRVSLSWNCLILYGLHGRRTAKLSSGVGVVDGNWFRSKVGK